MKNATFRQLRVFVEVAQHLSFKKAAANLHLTPPAVTMQIKELEAQVGVPLFEREGRQVYLSTAGEYMVIYAKKLLATLKDAEDVALRLQRLEVGTLTVGIVSTAQYFMPRMLADFKLEHEGITVRLKIGNRSELVAMLEANEVDMAVMGRPPKELATRAEPFAVHPHVFVAHPTHPLTKMHRPSVSMLQSFPFLYREDGSGTRAALETFCEEHHISLNVAMELSNNEIIKQAAMAGHGVGLLSLHTIKLEVENDLLTILDVEDSPIYKSWNVVHRLSKFLSPAAESFRYFMLERGESFLRSEFDGLLPTD